MSTVPETRVEVEQQQGDIPEKKGRKGSGKGKGKGGRKPKMAKGTGEQVAEQEMIEKAAAESGPQAVSETAESLVGTRRSSRASKRPNHFEPEDPRMKKRRGISAENGQQQPVDKKAKKGRKKKTEQAEATEEENKEEKLETEQQNKEKQAEIKESAKPSESENMEMKDTATAGAGGEQNKTETTIQTENKPRDTMAYTPAAATAPTETTPITTTETKPSTESSGTSESKDATMST